MISIEKWYKYIRILSLDIVTGACICTGFVARYAQVKIELDVYMALTCTVWLIYTIDHLLDAHKIGENAQTDRHQWHFEHAHSLWPACLVVTSFLSVICFRLPLEIFRNGISLGVAVFFYFLISQSKHLKPFFPKEIAIAAIYSFGVFLPIFSLQEKPDPALYAMLFCFFLLALNNLLIISLIEVKKDKQQKMNSVAIQLGAKKLTTIINGSFVLVFFTLVTSAVHFSTENNFTDYAEVLLLMSIILFTVFYKRKYFIPEELYRVVGDSVFLIPAFFMWINDFQ